MVELVVRQICFRIADAVPVGPFRLGDAAAEALSELLQVLACGEESAALAFAHFGCSRLEDAARRGLARVGGAVSGRGVLELDPLRPRIFQA